tara:strand:+ start:48003 stop:48221 length:219 start_codon:yes stop_codon:yes gene_type:complete
MYASLLWAIDVMLIALLYFLGHRRTLHDHVKSITFPFNDMPELNMLKLNTLKPQKTHQNTSKHIKTHQNLSL